MNETMTTENTANRQIARAASIVFIAMAVGQLIGQAAKSATVSAFGANTALDAYNAANRVSETIYLLVAGGALGSSFIPVFTGLLTTEKKKPRKRINNIWKTMALAILKFRKEDIGCRCKKCLVTFV